jgi:hypothetical protein
VDAIARLHALRRGFRGDYLPYDELTAQLRAWADAFGDLVRLRSLGETPEGRSLWLLTIGRDPDRARPAVWVDGNMHAAELCGSSVALAIAEDVLALHLDPDSAPAGLPGHVAERVREVLFYVMPRMAPDGAEAVLATGRYVRSTPRDERPNRAHSRWISADVDGDGLSLLMRVADPTGEFVESAEMPGLMVPRQLEDEGPFYKIYPEGLIEHFDGHHVPTPTFLSDNQTDLNRNFPFSWAPEPQQLGAGAFPLSEPESRAVVEFTARHPHIFAWLNIHTFGGVFIRPLGNQPDPKMDPSDLALFRQIGAWCEQLTGYPMVSGFEEFTYEPDKPLHGDLTDYAFHQRGCVAYVVELWDLFARIGMERPRRFVEYYTRMTRDELVRLARWDAEHNQGRALRPWRPLAHPQLGDVEVGGLDPRVGLWNPPYELIDEVCRAQSAALLRVAALAPALRLRGRCDALGDGLFRVSATVENHGYLPTYVLSSAKDLAFAEPLWADLDAEGCALDDPGSAHQRVGDLDGWGRGLHDGTGALYFLRSRGSTGARTLSWVVRGAGAVTVRVGSCRTGWVSERIEIRDA